MSNTFQKYQSLFLSRKGTAADIDKALTHKDADIRRVSLASKNATPDHISKGLDDPDWTVRLGAIRNPNASKENLAKAEKDKHQYVRSAVYEHPNASEEQIEKGLTHELTHVRHDTALMQDNLSKKHVDMALNDPEKEVQDAVKENPVYKKYYPAK